MDPILDPLPTANALNFGEREREVDRYKVLIEEQDEFKYFWNHDRHVNVGRGEDHLLLGESQASPPRPCNTGRLKMKTLGWLETVA
jgi:hypothetical protein